MSRADELIDLLSHDTRRRLEDELARREEFAREVHVIQTGPASALRRLANWVDAHHVDDFVCLSVSWTGEPEAHVGPETFHRIVGHSTVVRTPCNDGKAVHLTAAVDGVSMIAFEPVALARCGQPDCPFDARPGMTLCEGCWDLANDAAGDEP